MKAVVITRPGGPEVLEIRDVPRPLPRAGEVLVRVHASALNRADLLQRQGRYPAPPGAPANIPGLEIAGEVVSGGIGAMMWKPGDRVFGIVGGGAHAEYVAVHERELAAVPDDLAWEQAGAVPEAFITAHDALDTQAAIQPGERVLIHAVGSGVGLAAAQLARVHGCPVFGTARTADKVSKARRYGLDDGIVLGDEPELMIAAVARWSDGSGASVVLDLAGGPYLPASVEAAAASGRIILIGLMAGRSANVNLGAVLGKRLTIRGTVMRTRSPEEKAAATAAFARDVVPLLANGLIEPVIDSVLPLERIAGAHELLESNRTFGKVVLRIQ